MMESPREETRCSPSGAFRRSSHQWLSASQSKETSVPAAIAAARPHAGWTEVFQQLPATNGTKVTTPAKATWKTRVGKLATVNAMPSRAITRPEMRPFRRIWSMMRKLPNTHKGLSAGDEPSGGWRQEAITANGEFSRRRRASSPIRNVDRAAVAVYGRWFGFLRRWFGGGRLSIRCHRRLVLAAEGIDAVIRGLWLAEAAEGGCG